MTDLDARLLHVMQDLFENDQLDDTVSQQNCEAWDSLLHLRLVVALEDAFHVILEPEDISEMQDFKSILAILEKKIG